MDEKECLGCNYNNRCSKSFCMKKYKKDYYFTQGYIPENKRIKTTLFVDNDGSDIKSFTRLAEIEQNICDFVEEGKNLYLYSTNTGNGKTSWALRLCLAYVEAKWLYKPMKPIILFISVPKFLLELKSNITSLNSLYFSVLFKSFFIISINSSFPFIPFKALKFIPLSINFNICSSS